MGWLQDFLCLLLTETPEPPCILKGPNQLSLERPRAGKQRVIKSSRAALRVGRGSGHLHHHHNPTLQSTEQIQVQNTEKKKKKKKTKKQNVTPSTQLCTEISINLTLASAQLRPKL